MGNKDGWEGSNGQGKARLEEEVTGDLLFDYAEDEINLWFDDSTIKGVLRVYVYDVEEDEDE